MPQELSEVVPCADAANVCTVYGVSSAAPRATFDVRILDGCIELLSKSGTHRLLPSNVSSLHVLPQPLAYQGAQQLPSKVMLALVTPVPVQRSLCSFLLLTPKPGAVASVLSKGSMLPACFEGLDWDAEALVGLLPKALGKKLESPTKNFTSSEGHQSVKCHLKVNEGLLYLMPTGLIFIQKPVLFIPCSSVKKAEIIPSVRYLELEVTYIDSAGSETTACFCTIDRAEQPELRNFLRCKRLMQKEAASPGKTSGAAGELLTNTKTPLQDALKHSAPDCKSADSRKQKTASNSALAPPSSDRPQADVAVDESDDSDDSDWQSEGGKTSYGKSSSEGSEVAEDVQLAEDLEVGCQQLECIDIESDDGGQKKEAPKGDCGKKEGVIIDSDDEYQTAAEQFAEAEKDEYWRRRLKQRRV